MFNISLNIIPVISQYNLQECFKWEIGDGLFSKKKNNIFLY